MKSLVIILLSIVFLGCGSPHSKKHGHAHTPGHYSKRYSKTEPIPKDPHGLIGEQRQWTFAGKRTGEGYFSQDGRFLVFQSERESNNPFYQIYLTDLEKGKTQKVSPGIGKTTCAWVHPNNSKVMYSSTHHDPQIKRKVKETLEFRKSGKKKRYSWDYDKAYDIFATDIRTKKTKRLSFATGYDAEGSYSPNGKLIAFASNRHAYTKGVSPETIAKRDKDPSLFLDIYIMNSDGSNVRRLTTSMGYDGGPFFSPDGKRITWRRFDEAGHTAEVFTMNIDGSDQKQITRLAKMSWAPYYHPSGDYIVFTTNRHGYKNFELYIVDTEGKKEPVRVTYLEGFDGLPVFTPDGQYLTWTRRSQGISQIFKAPWDDIKARRLLDLPFSPPKSNEYSPQITDTEVKRSLYYFASPELNGRGAGTKDEEEYMGVIAGLMKDFGLSPGYKGNYFHKFTFTSGATLRENNRLEIKNLNKDVQLKLNENWAPLSFSTSGVFPLSDVAFVGYGLDVPETKEHPPYNSYSGIDLKNKWAMMFRYLPEEVDGDKRVHFNRYSKLQHKVMLARERGAKGVIIINGPQSNSKEDIIKFNTQASGGELSLPVISISDDVAQAILDKSNKSLSKTQKKLDEGKEVINFVVPGVQLAAGINVKKIETTGKNLLALVKVPGAKKTLVIGAHADHLGRGKTSSSLMNSKDISDIHFGADDNASGMSGILELAHYFSKNKKSLKQNILFALWSAEEIGVLGSKAFLDDTKYKRKFSAYINLDMIGRYRDNLFINGVASSNQWRGTVEKLASSTPLSLTLSDDPYVPSDGMPFYIAGIPSVTLFTGAHREYHTPRDTPDKINFSGTTEIIKFARNLASVVASNPRAVKYQKVDRKATDRSGRGGFRIYLGTIPDYASGKVKGMKLSGVIKGGPAEKAGLKKGDIIIQFGAKKIENIHDYVYSLEAARPNVKTKVVVLRNGDEKTLEVTPSAKR